MCYIKWPDTPAMHITQILVAPFTSLSECICSNNDVMSIVTEEEGEAARGVKRKHDEEEEEDDS